MGQVDSPRRFRSGALAFALILSLGAHFLYLGDIGKWREDFAWTARDPVTGHADWAGIFSFPFFWRPCSLVYVRTINTVFWGLDPLRQALAVAAHLFASCMLWRAMRTWGVGPAAAAAGALVFLVLPHGFEVAFWPSATPTAIATGLFLIVITRIKEDPARSAASLVRFGALAAVIPCWNEQPAAGLAALPILLLAGPRPRVARAAAITAVCGAACALYLFLYLSTGPHGSRGAPGSYTPGDELLPKTLGTLHDAASSLAGGAFLGMVRGSLNIGLPVLATFRGGLWVVSCLAVGLIWMRRSARRNPEPRAISPHGWHVAAFGLAAAAAMLIPIIVIRAIRIEPRMLYAPWACLLLGAGGALSAVPIRTPPPWVRATAHAVFIVLLMLSGTCLIGYQTMLRRRSSMDWTEARALKQLVPDPAPGTLFLAARVANSAAGTGEPAFDRTEYGAWSRDAYGTALIRHVYARDDLYTKRFRRGPEIALSLDGVTTSVWLRVGYTRGIVETRTFPWNNVVLFAVEADGTVRSVGEDALSASPNPSAASSPGPPPPPGSP